MYRALYDYKSEINHYLSFQTGDQFTILEKTHKDWFSAQNGFGEIGYIPANYVVKEDVSENEVLKSIDRAIEVIHYDAGSKGGKYTHQQRDNLKKLIEHRKTVTLTYQNPGDHNNQIVQQSNSDAVSKRKSSRRVAPQPPTTRVSAILDGEQATSVNQTEPPTDDTDGATRYQTAVSGRTVNQSHTDGATLNQTAVSERTVNQSHTDGATRYQTAVSGRTVNQSHTDGATLNQTAVSERTVNQSHTDGGTLNQTAVSGRTVNQSTTDGATLNQTAVSGRTVNQSQAVSIPSAKAKVSSGIDTIDCSTSPMPSPLKLNSASETSHELVIDLIERSGAIDLKSVSVPTDLGNELLEQIRKNTGLSYKMSGIALETVFGHLGLRIPEMVDLLDRVYETVDEAGTTLVEEEQSSDYDRLNELFEELTACKDDSQQRGWALQEDEQTISTNLEELISILENAKQSVARKAVAKDSYECVLHLVQYYQMETRVKLRLLLLRVFGAMCTLDAGSISVLLCSILTTELAQELRQNVDEVPRVVYVSLLLTMLFATGETVPANLHDHLNKDFIHFVFDTIEKPPATDEEDQVPEMLVHFILAFNLHFHVPQNNLVVQVIAEKRTVKVFTEKVLVYFNRDEDPVRMFDHEPLPPDAVMKLLQDMYSRADTANVLYTNDARVLIDIILRHLVDLSPGDKVRTAQLKLMQLYLQTSDYMEHQHRFHELNECLRRIQTEEEDTGDDKHIVDFILTQIPAFILPTDDDGE